jgi:LCP family protein required for cell wall assembly
MANNPHSRSNSNTTRRVVRQGTPTPGFETPLYHEPDKMPKKVKKKKPHRGRKIAITVLSVLLIVGIGLFVFFQYYFGGLQTDEDFKDKTNSDLGIDEDIAAALNQKGVTNIALFGVDARGDSDAGRSDSTIILSLDWDHSKIKLTSIARDTYVPIDGHGKTKLNHAYSYGGAELAIKTLNQNFNLNIKDYVTVNFDQLAQVIDEVGGVTVEVTEKELYYTNDLIDRDEPGTPHIKSAGKVKLTGKQALCFSRIRHNVGGDDARTGRQRLVLEALFKQAKELNVTQYPGFAKALLPMVKTSLNYTDCIKLASIMLKPGISMEMVGFPHKYSEAGGQTINGTWYYVYDLDLASDMIHKFIYDDVHPDNYYGEDSSEEAGSGN